MTRKVVYLCGTIGGLTYSQASDPRKYAAELLNEIGYDTLDPLRGAEILSTLGDEAIKEGLGAQLIGVTHTAILQRDRDDIQRANIILVLSGDKASWGTAFEIEYAAHELHKPVVMICSPDSPSREHPWLKHMVSYFASTIDEAVQFIDKWFDRGYQLESRKQ